jgi:hypothetical protein
VKSWLITVLVNFHAMRGDMADEVEDVSEVAGTFLLTTVIMVAQCVTPVPSAVSDVFHPSAVLLGLKYESPLSRFPRATGAPAFPLLSTPG